MKYALLFAFLVLGIASVFGQETATRQNLAVFQMHYSEEPPHRAVEGIDLHIHQVLKKLGIFNVVTIPEQIATDDMDTAVAELQGYSVIVISQLNQYELTRDERGYWQARIISSFTVFEGNTQIAQFSLETIGYGTDEEEASKQAVDAIPLQLEFKLQSLERFSDASVIVELFETKLILNIKSDTGIMPGDEYEVVRFDESGENEERIALLRVREVYEEFSIANIIYKTKPLLKKDHVRELPRIGLNILPYVSGFFNVFDIAASSSLSVDVRIILARAVYAFRPMLGLGIIFPATLFVGSQAELQFSAHIGAEYNLFLERFSLVPHALLGIGGQGFGESGFSLVFLQASVGLGLSYLLPTIHDNIELYIEGGYVFRFGLSGTDNAQGVTGGLGVRIR